MSPSTMVSWPDLQYQADVSSCRAGLKSTQKVIDGPYNIPVTYGAYEYVLPGLLFVALSIHSEWRPAWAP